jgi:hypothetical protein
MTFMLLATTVAGSLASYVLLHIGITHFGIRYGLSVLAAYAALLGLIGLWSRYEARRMQGGGGGGGSGNALDLVDGNGSGGSFSSGGGNSGGGGSPRFGGGGGRFGGGGASAAYEDGTPVPTPVAASSGGGKSGGGGGGFSIDLDGDELVVVILVVLALAAAVLAAGYIIWIAPGFLGDVLASSVAGVGLSRRITQHEPGWLGLVVKRTALPALAVLIMFTVAGFALQSYAPEGRTLHGAWQVHLERHADR